MDGTGIPSDPETQRLKKKLKLKLDLIILPLISMVYFFAQMVSIHISFKIFYSSNLGSLHSQGRTDLGNAELAGMTMELHLSAKECSNAVTTILVRYIVFQLPRMLLLRVIGPNWQLDGAMLLVR